jgi:hypothetical protein
MLPTHRVSMQWVPTLVQTAMDSGAEPPLTRGGYGNRNHLHPVAWHLARLVFRNDRGHFFQRPTANPSQDRVLVVRRTHARYLRDGAHGHVARSQKILNLGILRERTRGLDAPPRDIHVTSSQECDERGRRVLSECS